MRQPPVGAGVAVELAEEGISVFHGPVGQGLDKVLDLLAGGIMESFRPAEFDRVGLDEFRIEVVLADYLGRGDRELLERCRFRFHSRSRGSSEAEAFH